MTFQFEKLLVSTTEQFSRGYGFLVDQLNRAALSISANIAEGNGRFTKADRKHFFIIARGSVQECVPLLELARRRKSIDEPKHAELKSQLEEISKMLSGLINGLENRKT
jgi:four helix bundle protein